MPLNLYDFLWIIGYKVYALSLFDLVCMYVHVYVMDFLRGLWLVTRDKVTAIHTLHASFLTVLHFPSARGTLTDRPGLNPRLQRSTCAIEHIDLKVACINAFNIPQVNEDGIIIYNEMLESNHVRELFLKFVPVPIAAIPAPQVGQNAWFHFFFPNW